MKHRSSLVACLFAFLFPVSALAAEDDSEKEKPTEKKDGQLLTSRRTAQPDAERMNVGAIAGIGFPRPLAIEGVLGFGKHVMIGAEYGFMPTLTVGSVQTRLWAVSGDVRVFPFGGAFYLGLRGGYQSLFAAASLSASGIGSYSESVEIASLFVNPRIGFLWRFDPIVLGFEAGIQIPVSPNVTRSASANLAGIDVQADARLTSTADTLGSKVIPSVDLLRVRVLF